MELFRSFFAGRRVLFGLWVLLCVTALLATLRLSVFMFDPAQPSYSVLPGNEFMRHHSCFSAYVTAADRFGETGASLYDPAGYERHGDDAKRRIPLGYFEMDHYEYPPTFLLLPKVLLLASHSFPVLRALWFVFMLTALLGAMGVTAAWVGGREGLVTALLIPTLWGAVPNLLTVQLGNVQLVVYAMAIVAMFAFETRRPALGGAMLAFATGAKLSPGVLLLILLVQKRWKELLWTAGFGALYCVAVLVIAGFAPFQEFFSFQLPRLLSGQAFDFFKEDFNSKVANSAIFGLPYKLEIVGLVRDPDRLAPLFSRLYGIALVAFVVMAARKGPGQAPASTSEERARRGMFWMAILNLAIMQAPFLPPYGLLGTVWMLTLWAPLGRSFWKTTALFVAGWASLMIVVTGPPWAMIVMGFLCPLSNLGINIAALLYVLRRRPTLEGAAPEAAPARVPA